MCAAISNEVAKPARGSLRRAADRVLFVLLVILFGVMCLAWSLPAAALYWVVPKRHRPRTGQFGIMAGFRGHLWLMQAAGLARFDLQAIDGLADQGAMVIISNHRSLLDAVVVISRLPRIVCITKASLWDNWFLGGGIRMAGYIRNDAPLRLIRAAARALRGGQEQLLIFPEGTRSTSTELLAFKPGFALIARTGRAPVQTLFLETDSPYLRKGWSVFRQPPFPLVYRARLGRRFMIGPDIDASVAELEQYFRDELAPAQARHRGAP